MTSDQSPVRGGRPAPTEGVGDAERGVLYGAPTHAPRAWVGLCVSTAMHALAAIAILTLMLAKLIGR